MAIDVPAVRVRLRGHQHCAGSQTRNWKWLLSEVKRVADVVGLAARKL
jgi:hypothetical protein